MPYVYVMLFVVWNVVMASVITIPLYKIICNVSTLDQYDGYSGCKSVYMLGILWNSNSWCSTALTVDTSYTNVIEMYGCLSQSGSTWLWAMLTRSGTVPEWAVEMSVVKEQTTVVNRIDYECNDDYIAVTFMSRASNSSLMEFVCLQSRVLVDAGESGLAFFRMYNPTGFEQSCLGMYSVYPSAISVYVTKVQCFCFDQIIVRGGETVELPVLLYIDKCLYADTLISDRNIYICYVIFSQ